VKILFKNLKLCISFILRKIKTQSQNTFWIGFYQSRLGKRIF